jgi:hypothetical protein
MNLIRPFVLLVLFTIVTLSGSFTTSEKLDFTTEVIQIADNRIDIEVTIISGEPDFIFALWDGEPWENGNEIENSGMTNSTEYTFRNRDKKPYFVVVSDKNGLRRVKQIQLPANIILRNDQLGY